MNSQNGKPCIALLQGDACGIGPELMSKLLADDAVRARAKLLIVSDKRVFDNGDKVTGNTSEVRVIERMDEVDFSDGIPNLLDTKNINPDDITPGVVSKLSGAVVLENLGFVVDLAKKKSSMVFVSRPLIKTPYIKAAWMWMMNFHGSNNA